MGLLFAAIGWLATFLIALSWYPPHESSTVGILLAFDALLYLLIPTLILLALAHLLAGLTHPEARFTVPRFAGFSAVLFGVTTIALLWTGRFTFVALTMPWIIPPPLAAWCA